MYTDNMLADKPYETGTNLADYIVAPFKEVRPNGFGVDSETAKLNPHLTPKLVRTEEMPDDWDDDLSPSGPGFREVENILEGVDVEPEIELSVMNLVRDDVLKMDQLKSDSKDMRVKKDKREKYATELKELQPKIDKRVEGLKKILKILREKEHTVYYSRHNLQGNGALIFAAGEESAPLSFQELLDCRQGLIGDRPPYINKPSLQNEEDFLSDLSVSSLDEHPLSAEEIKIIDDIKINKSGNESPTKLDLLATAIENGGNFSIVKDGDEIFLEFQPNSSITPVRINNADMKLVGVVMRVNDDGEKVFMIRRKNEKDLSSSINIAKRRLSQAGREYIKTITGYTQGDIDEEAYRTAKFKLEEEIKESDAELRTTTKAQYVWLEKPIDQVSINNQLIVSSKSRGQ